MATATPCYACWSGTEGSVVMTKRYLGRDGATWATAAEISAPRARPRDRLEGMEFVPFQLVVVVVVVPSQRSINLDICW